MKVLFIVTAIVGISVTAPTSAQSPWVEVARSGATRVFLDSTAVQRTPGYASLLLRWHYDGTNAQYTLESADVDCAQGSIRTVYRERVFLGVLSGEPAVPIAQTGQRVESPDEWFTYPSGSLGAQVVNGICRYLDP